MKLLYDLVPVILFFTVFKIAQSNADEAAAICNNWLGNGFDASQAPIICATVIAIVVSLLQIVWLFLRGKKTEPILWISVAVILVFGSLTIWLHNEMFIKWKPTILYWLFAAILIYGVAIGKNFIKSLLYKQIELPEQAWNKMLKAWIVFFLVIGLLNLFVAYTFSTEIWVNFRLFGLIGLTLLFTVYIGFSISPYITDKDARGNNSES